MQVNRFKAVLLLFIEGLPVVMVTILKDYVKLSFSTNSARGMRAMHVTRLSCDQANAS